MEAVVRTPGEVPDVAQDVVMGQVVGDKTGGTKDAVVIPAVFLRETRLG